MSRQGFRRTLGSTVLTGILAGGLLAPALAPQTAAAADPEQGRLLANQWCASCHVVEPGGPGVEVGPTFDSVANDPAVSPDRLRGWLAAPHPPMPDLNLSRLEIESIVSYIESLRTPQ
jgi:mono/diheme cytochrome c family protein